MQRPGSSRGFGALLKGLNLSREQYLPEQRFEPTTLGYKSNALSTRPRLPATHWWSKEDWRKLATRQIQGLVLPVHPIPSPVVDPEVMWHHLINSPVDGHKGK